MAMHEQNKAGKQLLLLIIELDEPQLTIIGNHQTLEQISRDARIMKSIERPHDSPFSNTIDNAFPKIHVALLDPDIPVQTGYSIGGYRSLPRALNQRDLLETSSTFWRLRVLHAEKRIVAPLRGAPAPLMLLHQPAANERSRLRLC
jgi:hypothetical protein